LATSNPYALESQILQRLATAVTDARVDSASALSGRVDPTAYCPGIYVKPGAATLQASSSGQRLISREQSWQIHLLEINHDGTDTLAATRAGVRIAKILDAMLGWSPDGSRDGFRYESEDEPDYRDGYAVFTINLSKRQVFTAA
jgi:hypothetical protein